MAGRVAMVEPPPETAPEPPETAEPAEQAARLRGRWLLVGGALVAAAALVLVLVWQRRGASPGAVADDAGAAEAQPRPEAPTLTPQPVVGGGPITTPGTVVDGAGAAVAGASITAELELGPGVDSMPGITTQPAVVGVSDAEGRFQLVGLEAGRFRLRVEGPGLFAAEVRFVDIPTAELRLVVARKIDIEGTVTDGGAPVADIAVSLSGFGVGGVHQTRTDLAGRFRFEALPEGIYRVWAARGERAAPAARVEQFGAGPFEPVALVMGPAALVRGRVVDAASGAGVVAAVRLVANSADEPSRHTTSGGDGNFVLEGIPAGRWSAEAHAPGYVAEEAISFEVGGAFAPELRLRRGGVLDGRVVNGVGAPIEGAAVSVVGTDVAGRQVTVTAQSALARSDRYTGRARGLAVAGQRFIPRGELGVLLGPIPFPPPAGQVAVQVTSIIADGDPVDPADSLAAVRPELASRFVSDADGRFRITGLVAGRYRVRASHRDYADGRSPQLSVAAGAEVATEVVLVPGVVVVGTVHDDHGVVIVGATITADPIGAERPEEVRVQAITGVDGRYRFGPVAVGLDVRVTAVRHGDATRKLTVGKLGDAVVERVEDFVLPRADAVLRGVVRDPSGFAVRGATVTLPARDRLGSPRSVVADDDGRFAIDGLAAGSYPVRVAHADFPPLERTLATGDASEIELPFGGGISARVRDAHTRAPVAGAVVRARGPGGAKFESASGEDGEVELVPLTAGRWQLAVELAGFVATAVDRPVPAGDRPGAVTVRDLVIELARGATVGGTVRDAAGERARGARVTLGGRSTTTDEHGRFRLVDVPTGAVVIEAARGKTRGSERLQLAPGDEVVTLELTLR